MAPNDLLTRVRHAIRARHYSRQTEAAYVQWARRFVEFNDFRPPRDLDAADIDRFLTALAVERNVSAATQNQARAAILFLYREVLQVPGVFVARVIRSRSRRRHPVLLSRNELARVLDCFTGTPRLIASLLYGSGLRLNEALTLRIHDLDLECRRIRVRD